MPDRSETVECNCGGVSLKVVGGPIVTTVCHCSSCREAGRILESLPGASPILDSDGGTSFVLYRKDRVDCLRGCELLREHRLKAKSPTRRVVAACCNSFMFLDFTKGHWITLARDRFTDQALIAAAPSQGRSSALFFVRLMAAWAAMGFRTPRIGYVSGGLDHAGER